jgi:hypothetical protein
MMGATTVRSAQDRKYWIHCIRSAVYWFTPQCADRRGFDAR